MSTPAGWYPDPGGQGQRYFDGTQWTAHQAAPPLPPKPPQSNSRMTVTVLVIVGVAVGLWILGSLAGTDKKADTASTSSSAARAPAPAGSVVTDGKFAFQVKDMTRSGIGGNPNNQFMRVTAQGVFIILSVSVQNVGNEPQSYFGSNQKLIDTEGREYSTTTAADMYANSAMGDVNPGNTIQVVMTFDVPVNTVASELEVHDSMFSGGARVAIDDPRGN